MEGLNQTITAQNGRNRGPSSTMFADPSRLVRDFHGTETPEQARPWLNEYENIARIHEWTDTIILSVAKAQMKGAA